MKKVVFIIVSIWVVLSVKGQVPINQKTVTLSPSKDAMVWLKHGDDVFKNTNYGLNDHLRIIAGTHGGALSFYRTFMEFDLSSIPQNAVVTDVKLYLYAQGDHSQTSGSNESRLYALSTSWSESTITWENSPKEGDADGSSLLIPASNTGGVNDPNKDYIVDVTEFFNEYRTSNAFSYFIKLETEVKYRKLTFYSKDYATVSKRPKLEVTYTVPFVELLPELSSDFIKLKGDVLYIKYDEEEVPSSILNYRILDFFQDELSGLPTISSVLPGHNLIAIDLASVSLSNGEFYILEVTDSHGEKKYLRFKKII